LRLNCFCSFEEEGMTYAETLAYFVQTAATLDHFKRFAKET
jgi:hypothetical protein